MCGVHGARILYPSALDEYKKTIMLVFMRHICGLFDLHTYAYTLYGLFIDNYENVNWSYIFCYMCVGL